ncbi:hypothetical protein KBY86_08105 [Synechococcus sp. Lug-A]|uniref:hypothetical protein n=1 Tax=Synechococcus sp. Lug-A TaxID=2823740 RepID=UPI0020CC52D4|nr:hypothetical protein [Synechococcus sp. Lug-A]MCP9846846.1 hypothetical protein [Synechococcus sp. Lug-A]
MTFRLLALTGLNLIALTAVAALPVVLRQPEPRHRATASQGLQPHWFLVRAASGSWYLDGAAISEVALVAQLRSATNPEGVRFLPSDARSSRQVSSDLAWLRRHSRQPVWIDRLPGPL